MKKSNNIEKFFEDLGNLFGDLLVFIIFLLLLGGEIICIK